MSAPETPALALLPFPARPHDTLRLALRRLEAALDGQARAVAEWRGRLAALGSAVEGARASLIACRGALDGTAAELERARDAARSLATTAGAAQAGVPATAP